MTSVEQILIEMGGLAKPQRNFLLAMFGAFALFQGKANMTNIHRHGAPSPRTQRRWHHDRRRFDFADFNYRLLQGHRLTDGPLAVAIDATFIPKSGKATFGLANFWDSSQDRAHKGLELSVVALVSLTDQPRAWPLHACQTPSSFAFPEDRTSHYINHLRTNLRHLPGQVRYVLADSHYANLAFISAVHDMGLHLVTKLRKDADLRYLWDEPYSGRGRPKLYGAKVDYEDWSKWDALDVGLKGVEGYTKVVNHKGWQENMRVVVLFPHGRPDKRQVLMCSDTGAKGSEVVSWYKARFQIEFVFRDGKQHMGLSDGQMRSSKGLHFHFNASLSALNALYVQDIAKRQQGLLSLASVKRRKYNETLLHRLFCQLDLNPTCRKIHAAFYELRGYGVIAA